MENGIKLTKPILVGTYLLNFRMCLNINHTEQYTS